MRARIALAIPFAFFLWATSASAAAPAPCGPPRPGWPTDPDPIRYELRTFQPVTVARGGGILWSGKPISRATFIRYVKEMEALDPQPLIWFTYDRKVDCSRVDQIRDILEKAVPCGRGRCSRYPFVEPRGLRPFPRHPYGR